MTSRYGVKTPSLSGGSFFILCVVNSKNSSDSGRALSCVDDPNRAADHDEGEIENNQAVPRHDTQITQAEVRTEQARKGTEQAEM